VSPSQSLESVRNNNRNSKLFSENAMYLLACLVASMVLAIAATYAPRGVTLINVNSPGGSPALNYDGHTVETNRIGQAP
jgi:hypothetical protein